MNRRLLVAALILTAPASAFPGAALANEGGEERKKGGGLSFMQIQTLAATVMRPGGRRGVITVEIGVDIADAALRTRAQQSLPRLRAVLSQTLTTYAAGLQPGGVPNADYLAREFQRQTDIVLGRAGAKVLLGTILMN